MTPPNFDWLGEKDIELRRSQSLEKRKTASVEPITTLKIKEKEIDPSLVRVAMKFANEIKPVNQ